MTMRNKLIEAAARSNQMTRKYRVDGAEGHPMMAGITWQPLLKAVEKVVKHPPETEKEKLERMAW